MKKTVLPIFTLLLVIIGAGGCRKEYSFEYHADFSAPRKIAALDRGINLGNWFVNGADPAQYRTRFNKDYMLLLKQLGFRNVRIPISFNLMFQEATPSVLNPVNVEYIDSAVSWAIQAGLAVQLEPIHQSTNHTIEQRLLADPIYYPKIPIYWKAVATYFKKYPSSHLFFDLFNEPNFRTQNIRTYAYYWDAIQENIINEIRQVTPDHVIIVSGLYNSFDGLQVMKKFDVPNLVYSIHYYDPYVFTHQGAAWAGWDYIINARGIPYPSTPENMAPFVAAQPVTAQNAKFHLSAYGSARYNRTTLDAKVREMAAYAHYKNIAIICNEFGAYKPYAIPQDRLNYINDIRSVFEKYHISWNMWEVDGDFGVIEYPTGDRNNISVDVDMLKTLGLQ